MHVRSAGCRQHQGARRYPSSAKSPRRGKASPALRRYRTRFARCALQVSPGRGPGREVTARRVIAVLRKHAPRHCYLFRCALQRSSSAVFCVDRPLRETLPDSDLQDQALRKKTKARADHCIPFSKALKRYHDSGPADGPNEVAPSPRPVWLLQRNPSWGASTSRCRVRAQPQT